MIKQKIENIIRNLQASLEDAELVDQGKSGNPGTRLRAVAQQAKGDLDEVRKDVLAARG